MALLTAQLIVPTGILPTYAAVSASDTLNVPSDERTFMHVKNGSGASINVTLVAVATSQKVAGVGNIPIASKVVAVPAGSERMIGPITGAYVDPATGLATITYSATTTVTAAAIRIPADSQ